MTKREHRAQKVRNVFQEGYFRNEEAKGLTSVCIVENIENFMQEGENKHSEEDDKASGLGRKRVGVEDAIS